MIVRGHSSLGKQPLVDAKVFSPGSSAVFPALARLRPGLGQPLGLLGYSTLAFQPASCVKGYFFFRRGTLISPPQSAPTLCCAFLLLLSNREFVVTPALSPLRFFVLPSGIELAT